MASRNPNKRKHPIPRIEDKEVLGPFPIIVVKHESYFVCDANLQKITVNLINWLMGNNANIDPKEIKKAIDFLFERDHEIFLFLLQEKITDVFDGLVWLWKDCSAHRESRVPSKKSKQHSPFLH